MIIKSYFQLLRERLLDSYWFLPGLMSAGAVALLILAASFDAHIRSAEIFASVDWLDIRNPVAASDLLATVVGAIITVIGLVFSLTIVTLTIVASQYGSQVLMNFMADRATKFALGTFVATFLYCLLALLMVASLGEGEAVPQVPVVLGLVLAILSVGMLVYFIHHIARRIQVANIIKHLALELVAAANRLYPESVLDSAGSGDQEAYLKVLEGERTRTVTSEYGGYVQAVSVDDLVALARDLDCRVEVIARPGDFVVPGGVLARVRGRGDIDPRHWKRLCSTFLLGSQRTHTQDIKYTVEKLAELAVRALSPSINEPFVAVKCVDYLSLFLCVLTNRAPPDPRRRDAEGCERVMLAAVPFAEVLDHCFCQIVHYAGTNADVMLAVTAALDNIRRQNQNPDHSHMIEDYRRTVADIIRGREWEANKRGLVLEWSAGMRDGGCDPSPVRDGM